jgi:hypothetical protein
MTTAPLAQDQYHHNRQLFADYYLNTVLPQRPDWHDLAHTQEVHDTLARIAALWAQYRPSPDEKEAQTEDAWIKPVLEALGHTFEVQASLRTPDGTKAPDYVFYRDAQRRQENRGRTLTEDLLQHRAIAVGDAKHWERPLDMTLKGKPGDIYSNRNPSHQIAFYMQHSGAEWGILTNGRTWRLYHQATAHKLDRFYEVDLP